MPEWDSMYGASSKQAFDAGKAPKGTWGGGGGDGPKGPPRVINPPPKGPTAEEIAIAKAKAEAEKRRLEAEASKKYVKDFKDTQKKKLQKTFGPYTPKNMYLTHQPSLSEYETEEVNDLMSRLNKMTYGGYGPYSDTWTKIQHQPSLSKYETEEVNKLIDNLNKENKAYDKSIFEKWGDHAKFSETIKNLGNTKNYHQIAALDFMNKFNVKPETAKKLSKGYQHFTEGVKAAINPFDDYTFDKAKERAETEAALNALGIDAYGKDNELTQEYATFTDAGTKKYLNKGGVARKKYSTGTSGILDIEDEESEDISLTAFNPKFDDVPELTEEKEEEKINLFSETEKGDPLNELLLAEDGVTTLFRAKNGGTPQLAKKSQDGTRPGYRGSDWGDNEDKGETSSDSGWGPGVGSPGTTSSGGNVNTGGGDNQGSDHSHSRFDVGSGYYGEPTTTTTTSDSNNVPDSIGPILHGGPEFKLTPTQKRDEINRILTNKNQWDKDKWKRGISTLTKIPKPTGIPFIDIPRFGWFVIQENKKVEERKAQIEEDLARLEKLGYEPHPWEEKGPGYGIKGDLEFELFTLNNPNWDKRPGDDKGSDGPQQVPEVVPVHEEIQDYTEIAWDPMSYLDKIRAGQAQRAALQAKGIIQDNEIMTLNSGGLANLFRVKNQ